MASSNSTSPADRVDKEPSAGVFARPRTNGWLVGPAFDLLFVANIAWPLALLAPVGESFAGHAGLQFWQLYYVTAPHRWITLFIVFLDREQFARRKTTFLAIAAVVVVICLGVRMATGALTCLMAIDYVWNAWHFASQHHGVYRIYRRGEQTASTTAALFWEKWLFRSFLLYVILRVASATWADASANDVLRRCDWPAAVVPAVLIARDLLRRSAGGGWGGTIYLLSVSGLFLAMLWAAHEQLPGLVLSLATASALFHAIEYLALVSWSVRGRHASLGNRMGALGRFVPIWGLTLTAFVLILGAGGWLIESGSLETWLTLNVIVAFLHYAYDGLIWRRRPAPR